MSRLYIGDMCTPNEESMNINGICCCRSVLCALLIACAAASPAQTTQRNKVLIVAGHKGEAPVLQSKGRNYVNVESLAQILSGSVSYESGRVVLTLPSAAAQPSPEPQANAAADTHLSRGFVNAAIETLGSMREWASNLGLIIKKGYPVGNLIEQWRGETMKNFALATSAASNQADQNALQLLTSEYNNLQAWSDHLVKARNSMSAANYSMSDDALLNDPASQKIISCWKFLGPMLARGSFEDDGSCR